MTTSIMQSFKLSKAAHKLPSSPEHALRNKIIAALKLQLERVEAEIEGRPFTHRAKRWVAGSNGIKELKEVDVRHRAWWWRGENGKVHFAIKYGATSIDLGQGNFSIELESVKALPDVINKLIEATETGELDQALAGARKNRQAAGRRIKAKA